MPKHLIDTRSTIVDLTSALPPVVYARSELDRLRTKEAWHEEQLAYVREAMREEINRHNLNKQGRGNPTCSST